MRKAMTQDPEIEAIGVITTALGQLDDQQARLRVLHYANQRFGVGDLEPRQPRHLPLTPEHGNPSESPPSDVANANFPGFVDMFDKANPTSNVDKALVAAYWLQGSQSQASWGGQQVNNLLKDLGHGLGNVTHALTSAQERKPAFVRQVSKAGKAQQARKTYKLTTAGVTHVRTKLGLSGVIPPALADNGRDEAS
jgi:hypothetical protein